MRFPACATLLLLVFLAPPVHAQRGDKSDRPGTVQKEVVPRDQIPSAHARSAAEELKTFRIVPGFRIELVAAEPFVEDRVREDAALAARRDAGVGDGLAPAEAHELVLIDGAG